MAAPEEPELSQAQTEKLLQFQVDSQKIFINTLPFETSNVDVFPLTAGRCKQVEGLCGKPFFFSYT